MKTNKIHVFLLFVSMCAYAHAQVICKGVVRDRTSGNGLPYATVSVFRSDSSLLTGAITNDDGHYELSVPKGTFVMQISYVGFQTEDRTIVITQPTTMEDIYLNEETSQIAEVEVKAHRPLIERRMDKVVFNVSQSPLASGTNAKDLLKKAPGIFVDKDGNVTYNGKSVEVYIDDRPSYMSGEQLRAMLEGTDGSTIEKIELISNPGAKYDASGTGGIINIQLKKNKMKGLNGVLNASYGGMYFKDIDKYQNSDFVGLNLNYRTDKTYTYVQLNQTYMDFNLALNTMVEKPGMRREAHSEYDLAFQYYMAKVGNDWMIDTMNTLGFFIQVPILHMRQDAPLDKSTGSTTWSTAGVVDSIMQTRSYTTQTSHIPQHTANLNYTHVFNEQQEKELTVNVDYNRYNSQEKNLQHNADWMQNREPVVYTCTGLQIPKNMISNIYSAKLDFQTHFWQTGMIEAGGKYTLSTMQSRMTTDSLVADNMEGEWRMKNSFDSDFDYAEHVAALYIALSKQFKQHWNVKLGLRGEYTFSKGNWISDGSTSDKSYFNLFPNVFLGYESKPLGKAQQTMAMSVGYTRRIKRPNYEILNPFKTYVDAHSYTVGNTELIPEFNNDVEVNWSYSQYLSMTFNFSHTQNMLSSETRILPNGDGEMKWVNFGTCTTHGGNLALTELPIVPKFDSEHKLNGAWLALTVNVGYYNFLNQSYEKDFEGKPVYRNKNDYWRCNGALNAYLPKDWSIAVDGWYSAPMTIGYNKSDAMYGMGAGIRKSINSKGLVLNLQVQDLLRSSWYKEQSQALETGQTAQVHNIFHQQRITFSLTYMFGHQEWHKQRKVGDTEMNSRLGSGNNKGM